MDTELIENIWFNHSARCWQCADFARPCLIGETIIHDLLTRWVKEFHHDPAGFMEAKEPRMDAWRQEFVKHRMYRMQQQFGGGHPPPTQRGTE